MQIDGSNYLEYEHNLARNHIGDFWLLFAYHKVYKKEYSESFLVYLRKIEIEPYEVLKCKELAVYYNENSAIGLHESDKTVNLSS